MAEFVYTDAHTLVRCSQSDAAAKRQDLHHYVRHAACLMIDCKISFPAVKLKILICVLFLHQGSSCRCMFATSWMMIGLLRQATHLPGIDKKCLDQSWLAMR